MSEDKKAEPMANRKNIVVGQARIIWATKDGHEPAWVLPGGIRTLDQRWISIGATDLQRGFMAVIRGIAQPTTF